MRYDRTQQRGRKSSNEAWVILPFHFHLSFNNNKVKHLRCYEKDPLFACAFPAQIRVYRWPISSIEGTIFFVGIIAGTLNIDIFVLRSLGIPLPVLQEICAACFVRPH